MHAILADEFWDGNVPAQMAPLTVAQAAFAGVPRTVTTYYYPGDSACHEKGLLRWLLDEKRAGGPPGFIGFAISARMSAALHAAILSVWSSKFFPYAMYLKSRKSRSRSMTVKSSALQWKQR